MLVELDKHELLYYIEGCARGSHLRQGIWQRIVNEFIPKMTEDERDFIWWILRRDIWEIFFGKYANYGAQDFLRAMAALHRNNWAKVMASDGKTTECVDCYRYDGHWWVDFTVRVADEFITKIENVAFSDNKCVEYRELDKWLDLSVYEDFNKTKKKYEDKE